MCVCLKVKKGKSELSAVGVSISAETIFSAVAVQSRISGSVSNTTANFDGS